MVLGYRDMVGIGDVWLAQEAPIPETGLLHERLLR